ncbi:alpha/beta hydrolase [Yeosuana marina]|uniref:alpha/beta hydrolase n=1 Tax=Yeosuana marina TaxID=1565536 RepID=UPI0030EF66BA|tara:strand:+ start:882 stop:2039 length:1158 start_codon:yes stop_codon:yes gene_type:complete
MLKGLLFLFSFLMVLKSLAQVTFIVNEFPEKTLETNSVYLSGNFEGWSGGQEAYKLKHEKKVFSITIPEYKEAINFKFTLGNWDTVECNKDGSAIENRNYVFNKPNDTVYVAISNWTSPRDQNKLKVSTAAKNVYVFSENFKIPQLNRTRKISIYLPPNYNETEDNYPVLYMLDGQNMFDTATSYSGEWEVDEQLNTLYNQIGKSFIVVAINHGNEKRINEYSAWDNEKYGIGEGEEFLNFLVNTLKPQVDKLCRTKPDSANTAIIGSSVGGLFSHYAAIKRPDVFGKAAVFSPSFWYANECFSFTKTHVKSVSNSKLYYLAGDSESGAMVENINEMIVLMKDQNFPEKNIKEKIVLNGKHNESLWRSGFTDAICWLFSEKNKTK